MSAEVGQFQGPSALGDDLRRFVNLTYMLAATDFKLRFFGSALGYVWSLMRPLLLFGVLYFIFTKVVKIGDQVKFYPVYLLTSIVLWTFFAETTSAAVTCLVDRENLLRKIRFPRMVIPLSVTLRSLFNLVLNLLAVFIFIFFSDVEVRASWLQLIPLIAILIVLTTGVAMLLSALYVRFRDIFPIWEVATQLLFYGSAILFPVTEVPGSVQAAFTANPIVAIVTQMRHAMIDPTAPSAAEAIGGGARLLIPAAIVVGVFLLGAWVFNRETPRIAENL